VACKDKTHTTDHLNIKYPGIPDLESCAVPDLYPTTAAYKKAEFEPLPVFAKGRLEANECTGLTVVSTTPASGSPTSCKCERVTLSGPYSAGAMVSCLNCLDVRRATEKNSCPSGTKLFAPASRQDWDTIIKSTKPLRAPNWIIDVTRPQNGCGGCTNHVFNSDNKQQATWRTSTGAPWWLRSSRYNEPNGDYHANCYLDLWHNPKNADSVTWNDLNCNYHSKSYFCQAVKISTTPKSGSPSGCVCNKVELSGKYSAKVLLKCENCLDVYRANDKNSCPTGTKIFAPASREDWKTFIASAKSLRNPHWIIDVTRPQNGCGGCTRNTMTSSTPPQSTWQTADGEAWWLRSTTYNEPNGDYTANCYLDLWRVPSNENAVTWNDGNCNYHSKSYYCQKVKGASGGIKVAATTLPPWHAVAPFELHFWQKNTGINGKDEIIKRQFTVKKDVSYKVMKVEVLRNDLASSSEYVKSIKIAGKELGQCQPDGGDYDCTFFDCKKTLDFTSESTKLDVEMTFTGHSWDCDCDEKTWACSKEKMVAGRTAMQAVARLTLSPV